MRRTLLENGSLHERIITLTEPRDAVRLGRKLVAFNAVRGVYPICVHDCHSPM